MELTFDLGTISLMLGIISTITIGAVWVVSLFSRLAVRMASQEKEVGVLKIAVSKIDERTLVDQRDNEAFRHKYKSSVESLMELIKIRFDDWDKSLQSFKSLMETKIDLAISKNENKRSKNEGK